MLLQFNSNAIHVQSDFLASAFLTSSVSSKYATTIYPANTRLATTAAEMALYVVCPFVIEVELAIAFEEVIKSVKVRDDRKREHKNSKDEHLQDDCPRNQVINKRRTSRSVCRLPSLPISCSQTIFPEKSS